MSASDAIRDAIDMAYWINGVPTGARMRLRLALTRREAVGLNHYYNQLGTDIATLLGIRVVIEEADTVEKEFDNFAMSG